MEMTKLNDLTAMFSGATGSLDLVPNQRGFNPKDNDDSFTKVMNQAVGNNMDVRADINSGIRRSKPAELKHSNRRDIEGDRSVKDSGEENKALEKTDHKTESKEIKGKLEEKTKDVKDAIKDELSVTDEQIEEAMEALNMEDISLLDPNALKELLMELTGTEDQMSLVTDEGLLGSLNRILGVLDQGLGEISDELGISREDIGQAIEKMLSGEESIEALEDKGEVSDPKALEIAPQNPKETGAGEDKASKDHKKATENNSGKGLQYTEASKTVIKTENNFQNFDNQPKDQNDFQNQMQPQPQPQITIEMGSNG
nr:hypothetical protein [Lachnospiraceae bacterium]